MFSKLTVPAVAALIKTETLFLHTKLANLSVIIVELRVWTLANICAFVK